MMRKNKQKGAALIVALMVIAFIQIIVVSMIMEQKFVIRQTSNILERNKAFEQAYLGQAIAKETLYNFKKLNQMFPNPYTIRLKEYNIKITLTDMQSLLNLNNLNHEFGKANTRNMLNKILLEAKPVEINHFLHDFFNKFTDEKRVVKRKEQSSNESESFEQDEEPDFDDDRVPFASISQLRSISSLSVAEFQNLKPFICALPEVTPLNLQTAMPEVLYSIHHSINSDTVNEILKLRQDSKKPFDKVDLIYKIPSIEKIDFDIDDSEFTLDSNYYLATVKVENKNQYLTLHRLLYINKVDKGFNIKSLWQSSNAL